MLPSIAGSVADHDAGPSRPLLAQELASQWQRSTRPTNDLRHTFAMLRSLPALPALDAGRHARRATARWWPGKRDRRSVWRRCAGPHVKSLMPLASVGGRSREFPDVALGKARSLRALQTTKSAQKGGLLLSLTLLVAFHRPPGTNVSQLLARFLRQSRHLHSTHLRRSTPRTVADLHVLPVLAVLVSAFYFVQIDLIGVSRVSSQPPDLRCCDHHLNSP